MLKKPFGLIRSVSLFGINWVELIMGDGLIDTQPKTTIL
jgi:hypothetical protein